MKTEKFNVIQYTREFILMVDKCMDNFPKKDIEIKNRIRMCSYDLLELSYEANSTRNIEYKKLLLDKIFAKIKVIDFLLDIAKDKNIITSKKYIKFGNKLDLIAKYATGWLNSLNNPQKEQNGELAQPKVMAK